MTENKRDFRNECYTCKHKEDVPGNAHIKCNEPDPNMKGVPHGIQNGWFYYPLLFDPCWKLQLCNNYENHKSVNHAISDSVSSAVSDVSPVNTIG